MEGHQDTFLLFILMSLANKCPCILVFCVVYTLLFFGNSNVVTLTTLSCGTYLRLASTTPAGKLSSFVFNWWTRDLHHRNIVQELCESRGGRPGLSVLTSLLVSVDVKLY